MNPSRISIPLFVLLIFYSPFESFGQSDSVLHSEVRKIDFVGNRAFDDDELQEIIQTNPTPGFLSKFLYGIFGEKLGRRPQYLNAEEFRADLGRLTAFYQDNGYLDMVVRDSLRFDTLRASVDATILIEENRRSLVEAIEYKGLDEIPPEVRTSLFAEPRITVGMPYRKQLVSEEVERALRLLGNEGYPNVRFEREHSSATRYLSSNNFKVVLQFQTGVRLRFGEVSVNVNPPREDLTEDIGRNQLDFEPGEIFSKEKLISSERNLNRLGVFENARVVGLMSARADSVGSVPVEVVVRGRERHELSPEIAVSDENNAFNLSFGVGYTNRNFFGGARNFNTRTRLRAQSIQEWDFDNIFGGVGLRDPSVLGGVELQFQLLQPYLFTRTLSGSWSLLFSVEKQNLFMLPIIRNKLGMSNRFATYTYGFLEWSLERVSVEFLKDTTDVRVAISRRREEERPQFNSIISATLQRDKTNDIFSPTEGFFHSATIEESGILPVVLRNLQPDLPFTQFYKMTLLGRWYQDLTRTKYNIFALKLRSGYQDKYGQSKRDPLRHIPLNRRFFAGGSGSVRGWISRDLGAMSDDELPLGGNFIFEGSTEMRINYFRGFGKLWFLSLDNFWIVYFFDFGNVWSDLDSFRPRDVAIAAGFGLRYETLVGPFRVDFGFRLYDPKEETRYQWIIKRRFFGDVLANGVLHFGVGHAF